MFNTLPNDKILDWSKLKAFADNKMNVTKNKNLIWGRVKNIVFKRLLSKGQEKLGLCGKDLTLYQTEEFFGLSKLKAFADNKINLAKRSWMCRKHC